MLTKPKLSRGFTIVELLIVVVVIGVLATITVITFNSVRDRSVNAQMVSAANSYIKTTQLYTVQNSQVPMDGPVVQCFSGSVCWSGASITASQNLRSNLQSVASNLPQIPEGRALLVVSGTTSDVPQGGSYTGWYVLFEVTGATCPDVSGLRFLNTSAGSSASLRACRGALLLSQ